jgi:ABC-type multidrug transport system ATPase subunit
MNVIQTEALLKKFGNLTAVDCIDLTVPQTSVYGFLGPNGAGKTTTIRMLLGLIEPNGGHVRLFGKEYTDERIEILKRVGALVEQPSLYPHLTGWENLEIIRRYRDLERVEITKVLEMVDMVPESRRLVKYYSTGMRQRLGLAMALMGLPPLLILDEPTNGLDPAGIHEIRALITRLSQSFGVTIFLSSHLLNEVEQIATCIGIINEGRMVFQGTQDDLKLKVPRCVCFELDYPNEAKKILEADGRNVKIVNTSSIRVPIDGKVDTASLSRRLINCGISISEMRLEQPSLEDLFLDLTEMPGGQA